MDLFFPVSSCSKHWVPNTSIQEVKWFQWQPLSALNIIPSMPKWKLKMLPLIRDMFCEEQEPTFRSRLEEILKMIFVYIFVISFGHVHCLLHPLATFLSEPSFHGSSMNNFSAKWSFERSCCLANEAGGDVQWNFVGMWLARCCLCSCRDWKDPTTVAHWQDLTSIVFGRMSPVA